MAQFVLFFALVLARTTAFVGAMPLFSVGGVPRMVRAGLALNLAVFWFVQVVPPPEVARLQAPGEIPWVLFTLALGREALLGAVVALMFGLFLAPVHIAGEFISQQIGLAQSSLIGGATNTAGAPLTVILESLAGMAFLALDGHHIVLAVLHASFERHPLGGTFMPLPVNAAVDGVAAATSLGVLLGGPLALALFIVTAVLALMGRVAPQLNIYSVGFSLQALVAIGAALLLLPDMIRFLVLVFARIGEMIQSLL